MNARYFLDTNIIVYSFDTANSHKQQISYDLINNAINSGLGVISFQVIQEFINVSTNKFKNPIKTEDLKAYLSSILFPLCTVFPGFSFYEQSLDIKEKTGYSFFDAMIITAAIEGNCLILYTEDLHHGQKINGCEIVNPFL